MDFLVGGTDILCQEVYQNPAPKNIDNVVRRLKKAVKNLKPETLVKLVHGSRTNDANLEE